MDKKDLYTIPEAMLALGGISRNTIYDLMREGRLATVLIGRRRFVPARAIEAFIDAAITTESPSVKARRSARAAQIPLKLLPTRLSRSRQ